MGKVCQCGRASKIETSRHMCSESRRIFRELTSSTSLTNNTRSCFQLWRRSTKSWGHRFRAAATLRGGAVAVAIVILHAGAAFSAPPAPESWFGHRMGADRQLVDWDKVVSYFYALAGASDKIRVAEYGRSAENRPMI